MEATAIVPSLDCTNEYHRAIIVGMHSIREEAFKLWIYNFRPGLTDGKPIPAAHLQFLMQGKACNEWYFKFMPMDGGSGDPGTHQDITVEVKPLPMDLIEGKYSLGLIQGIIERFDVDNFEFFKAFKLPCDIDGIIIFKAMRGNNIVYYGNLSGLP